LDFDAEARRKLKSQIGGLGLKLACLAGYTDFCMGSDRPDVPTREMQILYVRELCRVAHDLDCSLIRIFTGFDYAGPSYDQHWLWCVSSLKECARFAASLGVTIGVQNHHDTAVH